MSTTHDEEIRQDICVSDSSSVRARIKADTATKPDDTAKKEQDALNADAKCQEVRLKSLLRREAHREKYTPRFFWLLVCWLGGSLFLITADAVKSPLLSIFIQFEVPESVLIALISGATLNIFTMFLPVVRDLFPHRKHADDEIPSDVNGSHYRRGNDESA